MTLDFTAIDFETANSYRGSPCSVGLVKVPDGRIVDESSTLIHPPARSDHFDSFNIWLHGIKRRDGGRCAALAAGGRLDGPPHRARRPGVPQRRVRHWRDPVRLHRG